MVKCNNDYRIIYFHNEVNEEGIAEANYNLLTMLQEDNIEPIHLFINSSGGNVCDMWSLIDIIENTTTPIYTYTTGYIQSSAVLLFLSGHKRFISKHAYVMIHQISQEIHDTYHRVDKYMNRLERIWEEFRDYILEKTKIDKSRLVDMKTHNEDWYITSEEAIKLGIATSYIEKEIFSY